MPLFAGGLIAMMLMTGVVLDGGNLFQHKQSLQNAADAAAIAATLYLTSNTKYSCVTGAADPIGSCAGQYASMNGANGPNGDSSSPQCTSGQPNACALPPCKTTGSPNDPLFVTDTKGPSQAPGCYVKNYGPQHNQIEVWLTRNTANFFGGIVGLSTAKVSARAIGAVVSGSAPTITFAALNQSCDNHTLKINLGGTLVVKSGIYVDSCNDHDGFDLFGGGSISAPTIQTVGGWETHDASKVYKPVGTLCSFPPNNGSDWKIVGDPTKTPPTSTPGYIPTRPGCPDILQPVQNDPFAAFPPVPPLGPGNVRSLPITKIQRAGGTHVATVVVPGDDSDFNGTSVTISGVGSFGGASFDGTYTVTSASFDGGSPGTTTFTYANGAGNAVPAITNRKAAGGVVTLTTNAPTTLSTSGPDTNVTVSGINNFFNFSGPVTGPSASGSASSFSYPSGPVAVSAKGLQQGTAKLTVASTTGLAVGNTIVVTGVDPLLNTPANTPVAVTALGASTISYADAATTTLSVTNKAITTGTTATLTTSANNHVFAGDQVTVALGDPRFNGTYTVTTGPGAANGTTFKYTIPQPSVNITNGDVSGGTFTLTTASGPPIENGDTVGVSTGFLAYDNAAATASSVNTGNHTFVYAPGTFQNSSWSFNLGDHTAHLATASAHGLQVGDVITVSGFGGAQACMNVTNKPVLTVPGPTTFSYQAPTTCSPGASGANKATITLVTASRPLSGTVSLTTASVPVSPTCSNCITAPAFITAGTAASGSTTLWDSAMVVSGGTFLPWWMPTLTGIADANSLPGSPNNPAPRLISSGNVPLQPDTYYGGICIGAGSFTDCSNAGGTKHCLAAGGTTDTTQPYANPVKVATSDQTGDENDPNFDRLIVDDVSSMQVGDVIAIDDEEELVTGPGANGNTPTGTTLTVARAYNGTEEAVHTVNTPVLQVVQTPNGTPYAGGKTLGADILTNTSAPITITLNSNSGIGMNDVIQIGTEAMTVTFVYADGKRLDVNRGSYNTTPTTHKKGAVVLQVLDASSPPPTVTLAKGVYIMAGGGFSVCGAANVFAPQGVLIYNTNDPAHLAGNGLLGQVDINTAGNVRLHPMDDGDYAGMTIFQDRNLALYPGVSCDAKGKDTTANQWDIALQSAAPLPSSGELGSITGTIYAAGTRADFGDTMSGTSNLAVITSCIYINGANSTFTHDPGGLFGASASLGG